MPCLIEARARSARSTNGSFSVVLKHVGVPKLGIVPFAQLSRIDLGLGLRCLSLSEQRTFFLEGGASCLLSGNAASVTPAQQRVAVGPDELRAISRSVVY